MESNFAWALGMLKEGYWVARQAWPQDRHVELNNQSPMYTRNVYELVHSDGGKMPWLPDHTDMQAMDWLLVRAEPAPSSLDDLAHD